jgi:hypothetical protein
MKKTVITLIFIIITSFSFAANYYVDATNGNDNNSGKTPEKAWQSIGKVNGVVLVAGDSVLFKRGEVFRGNLIPRSGSELGNITYSDYGTGNKPKILGSIQKNTLSDWTNEGGNIWHTARQQSVDSIRTLGAELLPNPDFNTGIENWYLWNNSANGASTASSRTTVEGEYFTSPGGGKLVCLNNGKALSDIQLWTSNLSIIASTWYKFVFKAKASQSFTIPSGGIALMQNLSPYTSYSSFSSKTADIDTSWSKYQVFYQSNATATDVRIDFFLGNIIPDGTTFYLDSLSFKTLEGDPGFIQVDVGNIIFNDESFCGVKVKNETDLNGQGKFWYDEKNTSLKLYSVSNPASFYSNLEIALDQHIINENGKSYITYENLDLRYGAAHGIGGGNTHHIQVKDLDFSWIGGGILAGYGDGKVRYGNGIEFWASAHDNTIERCTFNQIYDAALTAQGSGTAYEAFNIYFINNLVNNSEYSFEFWGAPSTNSIHDIYFENNTCMNAGFGWGHAQRPDPNGSHLMFWSYQYSNMKNVFIRNNIFYESSDYGLRFDNIATVSKMIIDYNCWYESSGPVATIADKQYDFASQSAVYRSVSKQDVHSVFADPLFSSDYTLTKSSPCIDAGINTNIVVDDYNGTQRPQGKKQDIGAFESVYQTNIDTKRSQNEMAVFPNPATSKLTISIENFENQGTITISNVSGHILIKQLVESPRQEFDISNLPSGIYFIRLNTDKSIEVEKIIKE